MDKKDLSKLMDYSNEQLKAKKKIFNDLNKHIDGLEAKIIADKKKEIKSNKKGITPKK